MEKQSFDFEAFKKQAATRIKNGETLLGKEGVLTPLLKEFLEGALEGELEAHIEESEEANRKNGKGKKKVKTPVGAVDIATPRDRNGTFEPEIVAKRSKTLGVDLDRQIIALYARGASYGDIRDHLSEMYDLDVSPATISRVTDKILPLIQEWRNRPLEAVYPFVWLDAIHYKVRHEGRVVTRAVYCIIGLNQDGYKELLGMYIGENEGAKFWLQVLTDLRKPPVKWLLADSSRSNILPQKFMANNESVREEMFKKIEAWKRSGQSQKEWCSEQHVAYHVFHYWYGQYRKLQAVTPTNQDFVSLTVKPALTSSTCEIVYPDGTRVAFHEPVSVSYLKSLLF